MANEKDTVRLNVGGTMFETEATTLSKVRSDLSLKDMLKDVWSAKQNKSGEYFIDRDPDYFTVILHLLQTGKLSILPNIHDTLLYSEARHYGVLDQIRSAKLGKLDGKNLEISSSITGRSLLEDTDTALIKASPMGGCSVAKGGVCHVYDWMFQEVSTINLDYMPIVSMEFYDSENIFISCRKKELSSNLNPHPNTNGGIGLFNPQTGKLKHKFGFTYSSFENPGDEYWSLRSGNLATDSGNQVFCHCKKDSMSNGIGIWNIETGNQTDFLKTVEETDYIKLQWLRESNCLMTAMGSSRSQNWISVVDLRERRNDSGLKYKPYKLTHPGKIADAIGIGNCVCVIDQFGKFGFMDIRKLDKNLSLPDENNLVKICKDREWFPSPEKKVKFEGEKERPKLGWDGGKLFCSIDDTICVYGTSSSQDEWGLASRVRAKDGGQPICDFSIGGDRLFTIQRSPPNQKYGFDVWETPILV